MTRLPKAILIAAAVAISLACSSVEPVKLSRKVKVESEQATDDSLGVANLMLIIWPTKAVDVGSKWQADTKSGASIYHSYEILARETVLGHDTFKISLESGGLSSGDPSGKATMWVDIENGLTVKANGEMKNIPTAGMMMDRITYTVTLVE